MSEHLILQPAEPDIVSFLSTGRLPDATFKKEQLQRLYVAATEKATREEEERKRQRLNQYIQHIRMEVVKSASIGKAGIVIQDRETIAVVNKNKDYIFTQLHMYFPDSHIEEVYSDPLDRRVLCGLCIKWS